MGEHIYSTEYLEVYEGVIIVLSFLFFSVTVVFHMQSIYLVSKCEFVAVVVFDLLIDVELNNSTYISSSGTLATTKKQRNNSMTSANSESDYFADGETSSDEECKLADHTDQGNW